MQASNVTELTGIQFWPEDLCAFKGDSSRIAIVERTHGDFETHEPFPERDYPRGIEKDESVEQTVFRDFLRSGIPTPGYYLLSWISKPQAVLVREDRLDLLDRSLLFGDVVKRDPQSSMSGTVVGLNTIVDMAPLGPVSPGFIVDRMARLTRTMDVDEQNSSSTSVRYDMSKILRNIPLAELTSPRDFMVGDIIIYRNWVGRIEDVTDEVHLLLTNGSVVIPEETDEVEHVDLMLDEFNIGDFVKTMKGNLRRGEWRHGAYDPNVEPVGMVVCTQSIALDVDWLCSRIDVATNFPMPKAGLDSEDLHGVIVYDRTRSPPHAKAKSPHIVQGHLFSACNRVKFKDLSGACIKYQANTADSPGLTSISRTETQGYDLNVFELIRTHTDVMVQWQDMTTSTHSSITLIPDTDLADESAALPGEILSTHAGKALQAQTEDMPWGFQPEKVGVTQKVNARDRTVQVRWFPDATVSIAHGLEDPKSMLLPDSKTGTANGPVEEVSLYEVSTSPALNKRLGDLVLLGETPPALKNKSSPSLLLEKPKDVDWVGEVVDQGLDGLLTIRLGALDVVEDVQVPVEQTVLAYNEEMDDFDDDEDYDSEDDTEMSEGWESDDAWHVTLEEMGPEEVYAMEDTVRQGGQVTIEELGPEEAYYFENLLRIEERQVADNTDEDNGGEEEWTTEESDGDSDESMRSDLEAEAHGDSVSTNNDTPMTDVALNEAPQNPGTTQPSSSILPNSPSKPISLLPFSSSPPLDLLSIPDSPPSFSVLSTPVPSTHHFAASPSPDASGISATYIRRIAKEHSILRSSLPSGIYVRTWESRIDLLRILIIGPLDTPYELAPFLIDCRLGPAFPSKPPDMFFHSWPTGASGSAGAGAVNPNLYEDGRICLSLLGTWHTDKGAEAWSPAKSTVLQVLVSLLGLVLVREPYYSMCLSSPIPHVTPSKLTTPSCLRR